MKNASKRPAKPKLVDGSKGERAPFASPSDERRAQALARLESGIPEPGDAAFLLSEERRARSKLEATRLQNASRAAEFLAFEEPDSRAQSATATVQTMGLPVEWLAERGAKDVAAKRKGGLEKTADHSDWRAELTALEGRRGERRMPDRSMARVIATKFDAKVETVRSWLKALRHDQKKKMGHQLR